ncbi:MAG: hypothetical protein UT55_C0059G0002 [Candidatus Peregrinibacteria bacterium GW2011_GWE2_39_6]|nr:MAG: hypothetical protein UT36_C0004G0029 [Candidatus Peregrinibacteria bacterium GW2011_GWF2_39_17]KKR24579.1 MAG: hypothetical protein UT55_C0059G0002 [Candidatus Peregrinibacteria bacterium GW2011_GWE2_39_6]HCW32684.1 hypothetical protein [Candidatus Peregrinibacteria bacterium]
MANNNSKHHTPKSPSVSSSDAQLLLKINNLLHEYLSNLDLSKTEKIKILAQFYKFLGKKNSISILQPPQF